MIQPQAIYRPLYLDKDKFIIIVTGGRGSGKSFNVSTFIERLMFEMTPAKKIAHQILYTRYTMMSANISVIPEFLEKVELDGTSKYFKTTKTDVVNTMTGSSVMFRGIKTSSGNQTAKLKSIHGITTFVVDEAEEWTSEEDFEKIMLSIRRKGIQNRIVIIMNPTDNNHWVYKRFIEKTHKIVYYDGVPVQISTHPNVLHIHTTYLDNIENLSPEFLKEIEEMKENDPDKYAHTVMGKWADVAEGAIFPTIYECDVIPEYCNKPALAQDYGFTNDPSAIIRCAVYDKDLYFDEVCYRTGMLTSEIIKEDKKYDLDVVSESADPRMIREISNSGVRIYSVDKGPGSINSGIDFMQGYRIHVTKRSTNLLKEFRNYVWDKDNNGNYINKPIDAWNHCFTADTLVKTINGEKNINNIQIGDMVLTSNGYKTVTKIFKNGYRKVLHIRIKFRTFVVEITGTPDHKIKTKKGWKELQKLTKGDVLYLCKSSMAKPITNMQVNDISQGGHTKCTVMYGNTIMEQSRKGIIYTILTKIHHTMIYPILNCLKNMSTLGCTKQKNSKTTNIENSKSKEWTMRENMLINGMARKQGTSGMLNMGKMLWLTLTPRHSFASIAEKNMRRSQQGNIISVLTNAKRLSAIIRELITNCVSAKSVEKNLLPTNIQAPNIAAENVLEEPLQEQDIVEIEIVSEYVDETFDIEVEYMHEFFANGILVHNCIDACRYYCLGKLLGKMKIDQDNSKYF